jgi:ABC-type transport system involved in multi-copper enzyme maturation permease subunit
MKFLAILKDSLLESLDSWSLYVLLALSALLIVFGSSMTFTPKPGGEMLMQLSAVPLSMDMRNFNPLQYAAQGGNPDIGHLAQELAKRKRGFGFTVDSVSPVDGQPDEPGSTFLVVVRDNNPLAVFSDSQKVSEEIKERFGELDDVRVAQAESVEAQRGTYVIRARLTAAGHKLWPHSFGLFWGSLTLTEAGTPIGTLVFNIQHYLLNIIGAWVALLVSVVVTAYSVPTMLQKGSVDLLLVKPISRPVLLLYKYIGGLLFIAINTTVAVGGFWLVLALRSGIWAPGALVSIPAITFFFAILYSVSVLIGVMSRNGVVAILATCAFWLFLWLAGVAIFWIDVVDTVARGLVKRNVATLVTFAVGYSAAPHNAHVLAPTNVGLILATQRPMEYEEGTVVKVIRIVYRVLPRTGDLNVLVRDYMQRDLQSLPRVYRAQAESKDQVSLPESLGVSCAFIAVVLGLACWWFSTKDY